MGVHAETVQKFYVAYFGRPADPTGLAYWENVITKATGNTSAVASAFAASSEYMKMLEGLDEAGVVDLIYHNLFGRGAELEGLAYWVNGLKKKDFTIADVVTTIANGARGADQEVFANKVAASIAFTDALDTVVEILAYVGTRVTGILQKWLAGITTDESLQTALAGMDKLIDHIMQPWNPLPVGLFETVNINTLPAQFDADTLSSKQAIEFVADNLAQDRSLVEVAPSSSLAVKGFVGDSVISVAQKTPGALKITMDADGVFAADRTSLAAHVVAQNAETLNVFFDSGAGGLAARPGVMLDLTGTATSLNVNAGGENVANTLAYKDVGNGALKTISVTGHEALALTAEQTTGLSLIDASQQMYGGLSVALSMLDDGGMLRLGGGTDYITVDDKPGPLSIAATRAIQFFERSSDDVPSGDFLLFGAGARVADAHPVRAGVTIQNGVLGFLGAEPSSLDGAVAIAGLVAESGGETVLFAFQGDSYVFMQGWGVEDRLVKLVGVSGASMMWQPGGPDSGSFVIV